MCGRFTREYSWAEIRAFLDLRWPATLDLTPSWNVAPTQEAPIARVRPGERGRELSLMQWGFKVSGVDRPVINARAETLSERPAFREAISTRRCVIPASGFYEWKREASGPATPYYVRPTGEPAIFLFAGLWSPSASSAPHGRFVIVTTPANETLAPIHHRMPAMLNHEAADAWLDPASDSGTAQGLLVPAPESAAALHVVSRRVNRVANDERSLTEPGEDKPAQGSLFG